ncbi:MAG: molybdenum ABC transporter ATP-binding protein [Hahellaceae bacterium]|nr:molybdenum ABC transporter ATP-binding protein [Hahellaceae bacterium]MCP5169285.1 molybdenum ABC transporter ATP-binding protein [Hahellaceae bacterium]
MLKRSDTPRNTFELDVNLTLPGGGVTALFGASGSGKTTLLRCIAGLEKPSQGFLSINGQSWQSATHCLPTHRRPLGYVFQEASLFPHLTAKGNLAYAIKRTHAPLPADLYDKVVSVMGIETILNQRPSQLSGGERQRVAIARALLIQPGVLLMDEPLAALDTARKQEILPYLEQLPALFDIPIIYVSHSLDEVARLADHMVVLEQGKVAAQGSLTEVFSRIDLPSRFGDQTGVVLKGIVTERDAHWHLSRLSFASGDLWVSDSGDEVGQPLRIRILARDVSIALSHHEDSSITNRILAEITEIAPDLDEAMVLIRLKVGTDYLIARLTKRSVAHLQLAIGQKVWAQVKSVALVR